MLTASAVRLILPRRLQTPTDHLGGLTTGPHAEEEQPRLHSTQPPLVIDDDVPGLVHCINVALLHISTPMLAMLNSAGTGHKCINSEMSANEMSAMMHLSPLTAAVSSITSIEADRCVNAVLFRRAIQHGSERPKSLRALVGKLNLDDFRMVCCVGSWLCLPARPISPAERPCMCVC